MRFDALRSCVTVLALQSPPLHVFRQPASSPRPPTPDDFLQPSRIGHEAAQALAEGKAAATAAAAAAAQQKHHSRKRKYDFEQRKEAAPRALTKKEQNLLNVQNISKTLYQSKERCCHKNHGEHEHQLCCSEAMSVPAVLNLRTLYVGLSSERARTEHLIAQLTASQPASASSSIATSGRRKTQFSVFGASVCEEGFRRAYGISKDKLRKAVQRFRAGHLLAPVHASTDAPHAWPQADEVPAFLSHTFNMLCDDVPTSAGVMRILPFFRSWKAVHADCVQHFNDVHASSRVKPKPPSFTVFERVRKEHFSDVVRPRKGSLPSCTVCVALTNARARCDANQRKDHNDQMHQHAVAHTKERRALQALIDQRLADGDTLIVRIDYTTSANLPHFFRAPKVGLLRLPLLLVNAIRGRHCRAPCPSK